MSDGIPTFDSYDATAARVLLNELTSLRSFEEVERWDASATDCIGRIQAYLRQLASAGTIVDALEKRATDDHASKTLFRRVFTKPSQTEAVAAWRLRAKALREELEEIIDQLEAGIDKTPDSADEQRELLVELKIAKKELTLQKREANETMRQVRADARQQSARIGTGLGALVSTPKSRRWSRMAVRLDKESKWRPTNRVALQSNASLSWSNEQSSGLNASNDAA